MQIILKSDLSDTSKVSDNFLKIRKKSNKTTYSSLIDIYTWAIALTVAFLLWKFKKLQEPYMILASAVVGLMIKNLF